MRRLGILALVLWAGVSCGSSSSSSCTVGASVACTCTNGRVGAQICQSDYTLAACMCSAGTGGAGGAGTGTGGAGGSGTGGKGGAGGSGTGTGGKGGAGGNAAGTSGQDAGIDRGPPPVLMDGTFSGSVANQKPYCQGFGALTGCSVSITVAGTGSVRSVTSFQITPAIPGSSGTITQTGDTLAIDLLSDSGVSFCPSTHFTGTATVGSGGTSMMTVALTGPSCSQVDTVGVMLDLTLQ
jgi:hypothetical protein